MDSPLGSRRGARRRHALDDTIREALDEMTEAVDLLVSPQLARQEIRALCRSMTEEVDAAAAPQLGKSLQRVARADFENWLADRKKRWRATYVVESELVCDDSDADEDDAFEEMLDVLTLPWYARI